MPALFRSHPHNRPCCSTRKRIDTNSGGFSLVEVLIAGLIFLVVTVGILPLFVRAVGLTTEGRLGTLVSHYAASEIERLSGLPFDAPDLSVSVGDVETRREEYQLEPHGVWLDASELDEDEGFTYHRIVRVRQYGLVALGDGVLERSEAISGEVAESSPGLVQLKEIVVQVESGKVPGAARRSVTIRSLKAI